MEIIRQRGYARAGLVGNPSDGYHGKTISVIVRNFYAEAILYEWEDLELILEPGGSQPLRLDRRTGPRRAPARLLRRHAAGQGDDQEVRRVLPRPGHPLHERNFSIRYQSNIPRQVGLAGSSAIIVATLRA